MKLIHSGNPSFFKIPSNDLTDSQIELWAESVWNSFLEKQRFEVKLSQESDK